MLVFPESICKCNAIQTKTIFFCGTGQADTKAYMENLTQKNSQETTAKEKL